MIYAVDEVGFNAMQTFGTVAWATGGGDWASQYGYMIADFDTYNGDNSLMSEAELLTMYQATMNPEYAEDLTLGTMNTFDLDVSGDLTLGEYEAFALHMSTPSSGGPWTFEYDDEP
jgi:hypothetical protein